MHPVLMLNKDAHPLLDLVGLRERVKLVLGRRLMKRGTSNPLRLAAPDVSSRRGRKEEGLQEETDP
jgi:hypothetical protein